MVNAMPVVEGGSVRGNYRLAVHKILLDTLLKMGLLFI